MILGKRAISEVLGALLMIMITVTAFTLFYVYTAGVFGQLQGAQPQQPYVDRIALEFYDWTSSPLKMEIRNVGSSNVIIKAAYIAGINVTKITWSSQPGSSSTCPNGNNMPVQATCLVQLTPPPPSELALTDGISYSVVLSTARGEQISLSATFGQVG
jgi:flagellin-like protein